MKAMAIMCTVAVLLFVTSGTTWAAYDQFISNGTGGGNFTDGSTWVGGIAPRHKQWN